VADAPLARSPIQPAPPIVTRFGWEVSGRRSKASLRLADRTPLSKVQIRAPDSGSVAEGLNAPSGRARRDETGTLIVGSAPGEWLLVGAPGGAAELVTVTDVTHGRALLRLTGAQGAAVLAKVCGIDFSERVTPTGTALRTLLGRLVTDLVRDDVAGDRSYLLHCERSTGHHLYATLLDAGGEFGIEPDGFAFPD
jgi:heterotetrameric sarcosine oxidase gamma subunit